MRLTNELISDTYTGIISHYNDGKSRGESSIQLYNESYQSLQTRMNYDSSDVLYSLSKDDKLNVLTILNTIYNALEDNIELKYTRTAYSIDTYKTYQSQSYYSRNPSYNNYIVLYPGPGPMFWGGCCHQSWGCGGCGGQMDGQAAALAAIILMVLAVVFIAVISLAYLSYEFTNCFESMYYNEDAITAFMNLLINAAGVAGSTLIAYYLVMAPLAALTLAAGISNPIGLVVFVAICLGLGGGALISSLSNFSQRKISEAYYQDSLAPQDRGRYTLSIYEEERLIEKNIDPIKVKCALVAMSLEIGNRPCRRSFFADDRYNDSVKKTLQDIRDCRSGNMPNSKVQVGKMNFDCSKTIIPEAVLVDGAPPAPSAPPAPPAPSAPLPAKFS
ncbi:MAG: hypothetical protein P1U74_06275 [Legionellaceae bacterium]|nr:hypothetical protein [Legionellaceae bacterium]